MSTVAKEVSLVVVLISSRHYKFSLVAADMYSLTITAGDVQTRRQAFFTRAAIVAFCCSMKNLLFHVVVKLCHKIGYGFHTFLAVRQTQTGGQSHNFC